MEERCKCTGERGVNYHGTPPECYCSVCGGKVEDWAIGEPGGGRGQLRESSVRSTASEGVLQGRQADSESSVGEDLCKPGGEWVHGDNSGGTGWSSDYYRVPEGTRELQDLIEHKDMNFSMGNIFKAAYRLGGKQGVDELYDLNKIIWFATREIRRIENERRKQT